MQTIEGRFASAAGGSSFWQGWLPDQAKAVVLLVHGVSEHTGRYPHVAKRLVDSGYAVYGIDHVGHGRSDGTPGNIGRMAWVVDDVHTLRGLAAKEHPGLPLFVLGHSLGSLISLSYLVAKGQQGLAGLALSATAVDPAVGSNVERAVAPVISKLLPNLALVDFGIDNISRDPAVVEKYRTDPLVYSGKMRARTGAEGLAAVARVQAALPSLSLPVLVMHGTEDKITSPSGSRLVYDNVSSKDKTIHLYDGLYHEIFNEPEQEAVLDDLLAWLDAHA